MTRRTSVYLTDELSAAVAEDGRSLPDLIRAGLELPSPLRLSRAERNTLAAVTGVLARLGSAQEGSDGHEISGPAQSPGDSKRPDGGATDGTAAKIPAAHARGASQSTRGKGKTAVRGPRCPIRLPAGSFCKECQSVH